MAVSGSPESDVGSFECFQNYTAPEVFVQGLAGQINQQDVESIIRAQKQMLQRFEKTNEMLSNCNSLSNSRFILAQKELKRHTTLLHDMKKDLDNIFKRIRNLKSKLSTQYPAAFAEVQDSIVRESEDDKEEEEEEKEVIEVASIASGTSQEIHPSSNEAQKVTVTTPTQPPSDNPPHKSHPEEKRTGREDGNSSSCDSMSSNDGKISSSSSFDN